MSKQELNLLFDPLHASEPFQSLAAALSGKGTVSACGLDGAQNTHLLAALQRKLKRPLLVVSPNELAAQRIVEDLAALLPGAVRLLPARELSFLRTAASSREIAMRRIEALGMAVSGELSALVVPADALGHRLIPRAQFAQSVVEVEVGQRMDPNRLMRRLVSAGYERQETAEAHGQCALRGGILDVFPVGASEAVRMEFFDDEVDSLRDFDVMTQRSTGRRARARIFPASEFPLGKEKALAAAVCLEAALEETRPFKRRHGVNRQRALERDYGLMSREAFFALAEGVGEGRPSEGRPSEGEDEPEEASVSQILRTALGRHFAHRLDALRTGRAFDGADMLIPVLLDETQTAVNYLNRPIIAIHQSEKVRERCENRMLEFEELFKTALSEDNALPRQAELLMRYDSLLASLDGHSVLLTHSFARAETDFKPEASFAFDGVGATGYQGNVNELARDLARWKREKWRVCLLSGGVARGVRLNKSLFDAQADAPFAECAPDSLAPGESVILPQSLSRGFLYPGIRLAVLSETDIFGASKVKSIGKAASGEKIAAFTDLSVGDYVVHENHGIGRYMGTVRLASEGTYRDFLHIQYLGSDKLYVPTDQMDRVQKYIGSEGEMPRMNRLSGGEWQRQKAKVKNSVREIAGELVKLYAQRGALQGYAFSADTPWQREFEDRFEFEETADQIQAIGEIKRDMEAERVMDRLLCGDVGYGKTEVALRAVFKCVMDGKQAALLAPTTILVQQHLSTMRRRFEGFPLRVASLSRFSGAAEQQQTIARLRSGALDVVVGTHRLLGKDVSFKDLGLLVVDEEQRFGVKHKETIKQMKSSVDVLTLSATPIPRTLHMSMVGIRDMSLLQTPPEERYPVQTYVLEYQDGLVRDAILREMGRGGQVYVLYNRVQTIDVIHERLRRLVPEARIAIGHGQMREQALEDVMMDFYEGKFDVLLCTTIIEAGLDVPRANTLIVCDADRFGLAQLYQLRGRVGRSNKLAYAYLTVSPRKVLTDTADKRLSAIREFTEFGSGFRVAMRDLEIRGTGNLLGAEQSGHMASVGYDLYVKMIEDSVRELRGDARRGDIVTRMELKLDAYLPQEYVRDDITRVAVYKKIAGIDGREGREDLIEELIDRFGDPGRPVMNLIETAHLKSLCQRIGIDSVTQKNARLALRFSASADVSAERLVAALKPFAGRVRLSAGHETALLFGDPKHSPETQLREAVKMMERVVYAMEAED